MRVLKIVGASLVLVVLVPLVTGLLLKGLAPDIPPPGKLVDVGGHRLHIYCTGSQRDMPPVLIEYTYWSSSLPVTNMPRRTSGEPQ